MLTTFRVELSLQERIDLIEGSLTRVAALIEECKREREIQKEKPKPGLRLVNDPPWDVRVNEVKEGL